MLEDLLDPADGPVIGYVSLQRGPDGDITAVQHKVTGHAPQPQEFVIALRWMADAVEIESLPESADG